MSFQKGKLTSIRERQSEKKRPKSEDISMSGSKVNIAPVKESEIGTEASLENDNEELPLIRYESDNQSRKSVDNSLNETEKLPLYRLESSDKSSNDISLKSDNRTGQSGVCNVIADSTEKTSNNAVNVKKDNLLNSIIQNWKYLVIVFIVILIAISVYKILSIRSEETRNEQEINALHQMTEGNR